VDSLLWRDTPEGRWIRLKGQLDFDGCAAIRAEFESAAHGAPKDVIVDMGEVTFLSSHGIRLLLMACHQLRSAGRQLRVSGLTPPIRKVFDTTGLFEAIGEY
jgi:anti-anti-sigma factor